MSLTEFLLARIAEDEAAIVYAMSAEGPRRGPGSDPRRLAAECEAKRRIVALMGYVRESWENGHSGVGRVLWHDVGRREKMHALTILENLAVPYADHPDYDESWRP